MKPLSDTIYFHARFGDYRIAVEAPRNWTNGQVQQEIIAGFTRATGMVLDGSYSKCFQVEPMFGYTPADVGYTCEAQGTWRQVIKGNEQPIIWTIGGGSLT
jgi:hypothetical protein